MRLPRSNIWRIAFYTLCAGLALGIAIYGVVCVVERIVQPVPALAVVVALVLGFVIGFVVFMSVKLALRQMFTEAQASATKLIGTALPNLGLSYRDDETVALRELVRQMYTAAPRRDTYIQLARALTTATDLATILANTATHIAQFMPLHGGTVMLAHTEHELLSIGATWGRDTLDPDAVFAVHETAIGQALQDKHPLRFANAECRGVLPCHTGVVPKALLCLPLMIADQSIGVLCLSNYEDGTAFNAEQQAFAESLVGLLTLAVHSWLHYEKKRINAFEQLSVALETTEQPEIAFEHVLQLVARVTESEQGTLLLLKAGDGPIHYWRGLQSGDLIPLPPRGTAVFKYHMQGWALHECRADLVADTANDPRWLALPDLHDMRTALVIPLLYCKQVLGVLTLTHRRPQHYTQRSLALVCALVAYAITMLDQKPSRSIPQNVYLYAQEQG